MSVEVAKQYVNEETKQEKINELSNLIEQYNNGKTENIDANKYEDWVLIVEFLSQADIEQSAYNDFLLNPSFYKIVENEIIYDENHTIYNNRIKMLHMTKLDFVTYVLEPYGKSYSLIEQLLTQSETIRKNWNCCNHVYRGNELLNQYIFQEIPELTEEALTEIFKAHNSDTVL